MAVSENVSFRGEGLNNLVLACSEDKQVYRLMKKNILSLDVDSNTETERSEKIKQILENQLAYVHKVIKPQILPQFIAELNIVTLPEGFAETIESNIASGRPDIENRICLSDESPDRPTISVEIKPKKGFMPAFGVLPEESAIKYSVCKFCIHQRLKAKEGRWTKTSHYCPIDLYSGNRDRMKHALYALCETPQNNLKICVNGDEVYGKNVREDLRLILKDFFSVKNTNGYQKILLLSEFLDLILDALLYVPLKSNSSSTCCCHLTESPIQLVNGHGSSHQSFHKCSQSSYESYENQDSCLPRHCILGQILAVQALDKLDIDSVYPLFIKIKEHLRTHPEDRSKWNLYGPFTEDAWLRPCTESVIEDKRSLEYAVHMVKRHNVSKTLQDCSLMVAFQRLESDSTTDCKSPYLTDSRGVRYKFSVSVIDLDYKPFDKVQKWHELELEMLKAYQGRESTQQSCS